MPVKGSTEVRGETESLQYSNWLRLQIGDFLKETQLASETHEEITQWVKKTESELSEITFENVTPNKEFRCEPEVVGDFQMGLSDASDVVEVEIILPIPSSALFKRDYLDCAFFEKRNAMLEQLRKRFPRSEERRLSDRYSLLVVSKKMPTANFQARIVIDVVLPKDYVKVTRFLPERSNLRMSWFLEKSCPSDVKHFLPSKTEDNEIPSPFTNGLMARGLTRPTSHELCCKVFSKENVNLRDAYRLLSVWFKNRRFFADGFSKLMLALLIVYLCQKRRVHREMSSYQIARNVWAFLGAGGIRENGGIALEPEDKSSSVSIGSFAEHFPVVFVDSSGAYNVAQFVSLHTLDLVEREARHALQVLESKADDAFSSLFVEEVDSYRRFDYVFKLNDPKLASVCRWDGAWKLLMDYGCSQLGIDACFNHLVIPTFRKALGTRASHVCSLASQATGKKLIGIILNPETYRVVTMIERGPAIDAPESADFRQLWGEQKVETRLMGDGSVVEVAMWTPEECSRPGGVIAAVLDHILRVHFAPEKNDRQTQKKKNQKSPSDTFNLSLIPDFEPVVKEGRKRAAAVCTAGDALAKCITGLKNSVLGVTGVQGVSPVFGRMDPCPPRTVSSEEGYFAGGEPDGKRRKLALAGASRLFCPDFVKTADMCLRMETSGKWPTDVEAVRRTKTILLAELGKELNKHHGLPTALTPESLKVLKGGYVFSVFLGVERELTLMELTRDETGMLRTRTTPSSQKLRREVIQRPILMSHLAGLSASHPGWTDGARLILRWVRSQMITPNMISDEAVGLLTASVFSSPRSVPTPCRETAVLAAFWSLIAKADFVATPLVVDFGKSVSLEAINTVKTGFVERRKEFPPVVILTPFDNSGQDWTRSSPSWPVLHHFKKLCKVALELYEACCSAGTFSAQTFFEPSLEMFDALIELRTLAVPRRDEKVDVTRIITDRDSQEHQRKVRPENFTFPPLNFDPVAAYLADLEANLGEAGLFFGDVYGGSVIGVVWKNLDSEPEVLKKLTVRRLVDPDSGSKRGLLSMARALGQDVCESVLERAGGKLVDVTASL